MLRILFACVMCLLAMTYPASARCQVGGFKFFGGSDTDTTMTVSSGQTCGLIIHAGPLSRFDRLDFPVRPKHGTVSSRQGVGANYRSNSGYKGEDEFILAVTGVMRSGNTSKIKVHVTVD